LNHNIEAHLEKIRGDREVWVKKNPEAIKLRQDVKREAEKASKN